LSPHLVCDSLDRSLGGNGTRTREGSPCEWLMLLLSLSYSRLLRTFCCPHLSRLAGTCNVKFLAPMGFAEAAVAENVIAGNVMGRHASYMYGNLLPKGPGGQIETAAFAKQRPRHSRRDNRPTSCEKTGQKVVLDGVEMTCILAPDSEAPSECLFHLPRQSAVCAPKDATHTMHNLYTLRARGQVPRRVEMVKYLPKALDIFGAEMEVVFASPHWQTWDHEHCGVFLASQRDLFRFIHDQTLQMANQGMTPLDIGEQIKLPESLDRGSGQIGATTARCITMRGLSTGSTSAGSLACPPPSTRCPRQKPESGTSSPLP
jgi:alkyl sulfatase BDS1-like metallo-beta-lactamase superfamily hydrolase